MALTRPLKEGSVTTYQQKVALGFKDILASEADGDHDTMYAAWNGALGGDLSGNLPNPTVVAAAKSKWSVSGSTLTPTDATKQVVIPMTGTAGAAADALVFGPRTVKGRLCSNLVSAGNDVVRFSLNRNNAVTPTVADDNAKPTWEMFMRMDDFQIVRSAAGTPTTQATLLVLDNAGTLTLAGASNVGSSPRLH